MEDSILEGLEKLPKLANTKEMQQRLMDAMKMFNKLSFEFQETWEADFWAIYESTRNPKKESNDFHVVKSHQQLSRQMLDLQEMAITLTRLSRGTTDYSSPTNKDPFSIVDEETLKYKEPTAIQNSKKECSVCFIF